jgi:predicted MFS family arabinose efflux permease
VAAALALAMVAIRMSVPRDEPPAPGARHGGGYADVFRHPVLLAYAPLAVFSYGGMMAVQALWAGPWLVNVGGQSPTQAARGLFVINLCMLAAFMAWGVLAPRLQARGWSAARLIARFMPISTLVLALACLLGPDAGAVVLAVFCVSTTVVSLSQPAVGMAFPTALAGRALSAYNLLIFAGVFVIQWAIGLAIDALRGMGADSVSAYRGAFALLAACQAFAYGWFLLRGGRSGLVAARGAA